MKMNDFQQCITEVKSKIDIVDIIGQRIQLDHHNKALCPFHEERNPSFHVNAKGKYFKCFGCGKTGDVFKFLMLYENKSFMEALKDLADQAGVEIPMFYEHKEKFNKGVVVETYEYKDINGKVLYIKERIEPGSNGKKKDFRFKHFEDGKWVLGRGCDSVLYNLPEVVNAKEIILVEGEGKVEALKKLGYVATCLDSGASSPWREEYMKFVEGKEMSFFPDNDHPGKSFDLRVANVIHGKAKTVKIIELPGLEDKEDIIDWLEKRDAINTEGVRKELDLLIKSAPEWVPQDKNSIPPLKSALGQETNFNPKSAAEILSQVTESFPWVWDKFIIKGSLWILIAYMKVGKSEFAYRLAQSIVRGQPFLEHPTQGTGVLILAVEEHSRDIKHRLEKLGMKPEDQIFVHSGRLECSHETINAMRKFIIEKNIGIVMIDTISRFWKLRDENDNTAMIREISPLLELARETNASIGLIHHERKSGGEDGRSIRGGSALFGLVDQALILERRQGGEKSHRVLKTIGRYSDSPEELVINLVDNEYHLLGTAEEVGSRANILAVRDALSTVNEKGIKELEEETNLKNKAIRRALEVLEKEGALIKEGSGKKNSPFRYRLCDSGNSFPDQDNSIGEETNHTT